MVSPEAQVEANALLVSVLDSMRRNPPRFAPPATRAKNSDLAQRLISNVKFNVKPFEGPKPKERPSLVSRIFDVISRPLYGVNEAIKSGIEASQENRGFLGSVGEVLEGVGEGVSGKEKTTFADVLETGGMGSGPGRAIAGFAGDILLDPLTYVGGLGLIKNVAQRTARTGQEVLGGIRESTESTARELTERAAQSEFNFEDIIPKTLGEQRPQAQAFIREPSPAPKWNAADFVNRAGSVAPPSTTEIPRVRLNLPNTEGATEALQRPTLAIPSELRSMPVAEALPKLLKSQQRAANKIRQRNQTYSTRNIATAEELLERAKLMGDEITTKQMPLPKISPERKVRAEELADRYLSTNKHREINPTGQMQMFNRILDDVTRSLAEGNKIKNPRAPRFDKARYNTAFEMLRVAEEAAERQGRVFVDSDGVPVKLSEIMNELGGPRQLIKEKSIKEAFDAYTKGDTSRLENPQLARAIEKTKARRAQVQADVSSRILSYATERAEQIEAMTSAARAREARDALSQAVTSVQRQAGASTGDVRASKDFLKKLFNTDQDASYSAIERVAARLLRQSATGKIDPENIIDMNKGVYTVMGANPRVLATQTVGNRAFEAIMTRIATWWGAKDLKPFQRQYLDTARINAAAFEQAWTNTVKKTTPEQRRIGFQVAQGVIDAPTPIERQLAAQFQDSMEKLFHSSSLDDSVAKGNTVALRAGVTMDEMNEALRAFGSKYQFTNKKNVEDKYGNVKDYSNEADWLKSWESMDIEDPMQFLHQMNTALQRVTRKNAMLDDAVARWGMPIRTGAFSAKVNNPRIGSFYFPKEIAEQMNVLLKQMDPENYKPNSNFIRQYDRVLRAWKSGVTIYSPSHHIRNMIGDIWLSALDGVVGTRSYTLAARTLHSQRSRYKDLQDVYALTDPQSLKNAMTRTGDVALTTKGGIPLTFDQIYVAAHNMGLLPRASVLEDIITDSGRLIGDLPITKGRVREGAHALSENRDHFVRLAHFIDKLKKSNTKNIHTAFEDAAQRVRKYHPDGMDLTQFEQRVMRRIIPFYSWLRKAAPLMVEAMVMRPDLVTLYPKGMMALQEATGVEGVSGFGDPFPADQMFPDWIREKGVGPVLHQGMGGLPGVIASLARKDPEGYVQVNPSVPFNDIIGDMSNPMSFLKSAITPAVGTPVEVLSGEEATGAPIDNWQEYAARQLPPLDVLMRISGQTNPDEPFRPEKLINWLSALGLTGTGPYQQQAAWENRLRNNG